MNPNTVKKLLEHTPEMQEFRDFVASEIKKLDTISDFNPGINGDEALATEVVARKRAIKVLEGILAPLLHVDNSAPANPSEYVVE